MTDVQTPEKTSEEQEKTTGSIETKEINGIKVTTHRLANGNVVSVYHTDSQERQEGEDYMMYSFRRKMHNAYLKKKLKGVKIWPPYGFKNITYTPETDAKIAALYEELSQNNTK
jgi:hypothetical protein